MGPSGSCLIVTKILAGREYMNIIKDDIPKRIPCYASPCKAGCVGIEVTTTGPVKYYLTSGDCRAPSSDDCCLNINRSK